jgi:SAM-dependent methyltransferase
VNRVRAFSARLSRALGWRLTRVSDRLDQGPSLAGDRTLEWAWTLARLHHEPGHVLDFGAGNGFLSLAASFRGHRVVAVDLEPCAFDFEGTSIDYRRGDLNELEFEEGTFDQILNCSTIEHVGVGGRYGSPTHRDGDLLAMAKLARLLNRHGDMVLTLPVGLDAVYAPHHRVYGEGRLPRLLEAYAIREERFWAKVDGRAWTPVARDIALGVQGSASYYALGLFVVSPK